MSTLLKNKKIVIGTIIVLLISVSIVSFPIYNFSNESSNSGVDVVRIAFLFSIFTCASYLEKLLKKNSIIKSILISIIASLIGVVLIYIFPFLTKISVENILKMEHIIVHMFTFILMSFLGSILNLYKINK